MDKGLFLILMWGFIIYILCGFGVKSFILNGTYDRYEISEEIAVIIVWPLYGFLLFVKGLFNMILNIFKES